MSVVELGNECKRNLFKWMLVLGEIATDERTYHEAKKKKKKRTKRRVKGRVVADQRTNGGVSRGKKQ